MTITFPTSAELHQELDALRQRTTELERQLANCQQSSTDDIFFTRALDMLSIVGFDGYFKKINAAWSRQLGYTDAEIFAQPFINFVHPDDIDRTLAEAARLNTGAGDTIAFETATAIKMAPINIYAGHVQAIPPAS